MRVTSENKIQRSTLYSQEWRKTSQETTRNRDRQFPRPLELQKTGTQQETSESPQNIPTEPVCFKPMPHSKTINQLPRVPVLLKFSVSLPFLSPISSLGVGVGGSGGKDQHWGDDQGGGNGELEKLPAAAPSPLNASNHLERRWGRGLKSSLSVD